MARRGSPPKYLLRDRDGIYGLEFRRRVKALGLKELRIAPRSPWQSRTVKEPNLAIAVARKVD